MTKMIEALFPMGKRKLMVSLIALVISVVMEKFGGGLSDNLRVSLIAIVAIFAGGNVGEHIADAIKFLKGTKVGEIIEDIIPGDQGLKAMSSDEKAEAAHGAAMEAQAHAAKIDQAAGERIAELEKKLAVQAQNMGQIVQLLNQIRNPNGGPGPTAPRQP